MVGWGGGGRGAVTTRYRQDTPPSPSFFLFSPATFSLINCDEGENKAF